MRRSLGKSFSWAVVLPVLLAPTAVGAQQATGTKAQVATERPDLIALCSATKNKTDKCPWKHNFVEVYEKFLSPLRDSAEDILEIGIAKGHSMNLWADYFTSATIHGVDIADTSNLGLSAERHRAYIGDQASRDDLRAVVEKAAVKFDIIIDDGGHSMEQQQVSMGFLFPYLKNGGYYILEDVHTSLIKGFGVEEGGANSTLRMINEYYNGRGIKSQYMSDQEARYITRNIHLCNLASIAKRHSLAWICKKK